MRWSKPDRIRLDECLFTDTLAHQFDDAAELVDDLHAPRPTQRWWSSGKPPSSSTARTLLASRRIKTQLPHQFEKRARTVRATRVACPQHADQFVEFGARTDVAKIVISFDVRGDAVFSIEMRLAKDDFSLHNPLIDGGGACHLDMLADATAPSETQHAGQQIRCLLQAKIGEIAEHLDNNERQSVARRMPHDKPDRLRAIGQHLNLSSEHVRQIQNNIGGKIGTAVDQSDKLLMT